MFYGSNVWDPGLIIAQIISVQCLFYVSLGLIQAVMLGPILGHITVAFMFDWATLHWATKLGWLNWLAHVTNALAGAAALAWLVERAKKCLDFGATCYIWHTIFVVWYSGWPRSFAWWSANLSGLLTMVLLGEWLCVRREMQDIPLSIPQRLGSSLLSRRKESGAVGIPMMPLASEDPDLPPRPRLRTGLGASSTTQRAAAAVASSTSFSSSSGSAAAAVAGVSPVPPAPPAGGGGGSAAAAGAARPGSAVQMAAITPPRPDGAGGPHVAAAGGGSASRKKLLVTRPPSSSNLFGGGAKQPSASGGGQAAAPAAAAAVSGAAAAAVAAAVPAAPALPGEVEPV